MVVYIATVYYVQLWTNPFLDHVNWDQKLRFNVFGLKSFVNPLYSVLCINNMYFFHTLELCMLVLFPIIVIFSKEKVVFIYILNCNVKCSKRNKDWRTYFSLVDLCTSHQSASAHQQFYVAYSVFQCISIGTLHFFQSRTR